MHKYSQKAGSFVVMAHYTGEDREVRSFTVDAETPIRQIFSILWPNGVTEGIAGTRFCPTPVRIEIAADERTIPAVDEPNIYEVHKAPAA